MQPMKPHGINSSSSEELNIGKIPFPLSFNKRDSGYSTDAVNSPASFNSMSSGRSTQRRFTFESSYDTDVDLPVELEDLTLDESGEVFEDVDTIDLVKSVATGAPHDDAEELDKEVADLTGNIKYVHAKSEPIAIQRPPAPVPTPEVVDDDEDQDNVVRRFGDYSEECHLISSSYRHTSWTQQDRRRHRFRPIASRSFGTQTPSPNGQIIRQALVKTNRIGRTRPRLRIRTESETSDCSAQLPDVIPFARDRSTSLPSVSCQRIAQELEVGRELRRISDEFLSSFTPYRRNDSTRHASSLPTRVTVNIQATWTRIRRVFSNSALSQE